MQKLNKSNIKWNIELVRDFVEGEEGNGCKLLSNNYKNMYTRIEVKCSCGKSYETTFTSFKNKNKKQCNECGELARTSKRKLSYDTVKQFIEIDSNSNCKLLSKVYENNHTNINLECSCGKTFKTTYENFVYQNTRQCGECSNHIQWDYNLVKRFIKANSDCELLSEEYISVDKNMDFQCKCGNVFTTTFNIFNSNNKRQCNECSGVTDWNVDLVKEFVEENSCKLLSNEYVNMHSNMTFMCDCGEIFETTFSIFKNKNKRQCNECGATTTGNKLKLSYDDVKRFVEIESNSGCKLLSTEYKNNNTHMRFLCSCGSEFKTTLTKFKNDNKIQCNKCSNISSKMEVAITQYLTKHSIPFIAEHRFDDCRNKNSLPFDFAVFDNYNNLKLLIEADGEGHYRPVNFGGCSDEDALKRHLKAQNNDNIKNKYCKDKNIHLIRIPYWESNNIENILESALP